MLILQHIKTNISKCRKHEHWTYTVEMFYQTKSTSIKIWISFLFPQMVKIIQIGSHIAIIFTTFSSTQQVLKVIIIIIFIGKQGEIVDTKLFFPFLISAVKCNKCYK